MEDFYLCLWYLLMWIGVFWNAGKLEAEKLLEDSQPLVALSPPS